MSSRDSDPQKSKNDLSSYSLEWPLNSYPKVHLEIGEVLRGGMRPRHAPERVQLWLIQQDLLNLIQVQVALVHLQDLGKYVKV